LLVNLDEKLHLVAAFDIAGNTDPIGDKVLVIP
jgi:hypothetical protein